MPSPVELQCPHCGTRLRLKNRENVGRKFRCRACRQVFRGTDVDSDVVYDAEMDEGPEFEPPPSTRGNRQKQLRKLAKLHKKRLIVGAVGLVVVAGLFLLPWRSITRAINKVNPLADTRQSLLSALQAERRAAEKAIALGNKEEAREEAGKQLEQIVENIDNIYLRALRLEPWTKVEATGFDPSNTEPGVYNFEAVAPGAVQGRKSQFRPSDSIRPGDPRFGPMVSIQVRGTMTAATILEVETRRPPENAADEIELEIIDVMRDALDAITRSNSAGAMADTVEDLESHAEKIQKLFAQLQTERAAHQQNVNRFGTTEYEGIRHRLLKKMEKAESILRNRHYADNSLSRAIEEIEDIDPKIAGDRDQW